MLLPLFKSLIFIAISASCHATLLLVGDSNSTDAFAKYPFPYHLQQVLHEEVINDAIGGSFLYNINDRLAKHSSFDKVVITLGINDICVYPQQEVFTQLMKAIKSLRDKKVKIYIGVVNAIDLHFKFDAIEEELKWELMYDELKECDVTLFPYLDSFVIPFTVDGFHLNDVGHVIAAKRILLALD